MNKENAHLFLPLVQALADGKSIQFKNYFNDKSERWEDFEDGDPVRFCGHPEDYRIKPEPRIPSILSLWVDAKGNLHQYNTIPFQDWKRIEVQEVLK